MKPGRWGWPAGDPLYGTGAFCPNHFPGRSRTARCGVTMDPEFKNTEVRRQIFPEFKQRLNFYVFQKSQETTNETNFSCCNSSASSEGEKCLADMLSGVNDVLILCPIK